MNKSKYKTGNIFHYTVDEDTTLELMLKYSETTKDLDGNETTTYYLIKTEDVNNISPLTFAFTKEELDNIG